MNNKKIIIGFVLVTFLILAGGVYILSITTANPAVVSLAQNAKVDVDQKTHDWGTIPYSGGNVSKTFTIKNSGTDILQLINVKTSCACTYAQVIIDGKISPRFGMHTTSSWIGELAPGKTAEMEVVFDPVFHGPQGVGAFERLVSIETNDINNPILEFSLRGVVVK